VEALPALLPVVTAFKLPTRYRDGIVDKNWACV
jgi:hypothetical protein